MAPATVQVLCMEPVVFLRGQSAVGEDARGRRRPINFDAPPSQLRGLLTLNLPRPSRIKEITITLQGKARTDWPEGIGPNRLDTFEESFIFKQKVTLYNARDTAPSRTRPRASSIGPGIDWPNDEFEWPITPTAGGSTTPLAAGPVSSDTTLTPPPSAEARQSPKVPRSITRTAAKAGAAILPPTLMRDINVSRQASSNGTALPHSTNRISSTMPTATRPHSTALTTTSNGAMTSSPSPTRQSTSASSSPLHTPRPTSASRSPLQNAHAGAEGYFEPPPHYASSNGEATNGAGATTSAAALPTENRSTSPASHTSAPALASANTAVTSTNKGKGRATTPAATTASSSSSASPAAVRRSIKGLLGALRKEDDGEASKSTRFAADPPGSHRQASTSRSTAWMYEAEEEGHSDWREFPKGTHSYPFSIPLPSNLPPTLHTDFGSNSYRLRAHVHRAGPLTSNLSGETEVTLVHAPDEDGSDEVETIVVERNWEDALRYMIVVMGKSFPVGGKVPVWAKFVPMEKVRIHRILAALEERTAYYAKGRRIARHEVPRRWTLLKIAPPQTATPSKSVNAGILPILSSDPNAILESPLAPLARSAANSYADVTAGSQEDAVNSALASLGDPGGPWEFTMDLELPRSGTTRINISSNHLKSNISVHHLVKLSIRVERLDGYGSADIASIPDNQRKLYDILIEAPVAINHSHTANAWLTLPDYWSVPPADEEDDAQGGSSNTSSSAATSQRWLRLTAAAAAAQSFNRSSHNGGSQSAAGAAAAAIFTAPQSRQATVSYRSSYLDGTDDPAGEVDVAGPPTYAMIDGARGTVDPPPGSTVRPKRIAR